MPKKEPIGYLASAKRKEDTLAQVELRDHSIECENKEKNVTGVGPGQRILWDDAFFLFLLYPDWLHW